MSADRIDARTRAGRDARAAVREITRVAFAFADEGARCQIECDCRDERIAGVLWWDTSARDGDDDDGFPGVVMTVDACARYLELRDLIVRHPQQPHLVRFTDRITLPGAAGIDSADEATAS